MYVMYCVAKCLYIIHIYPHMPFSIIDAVSFHICSRKIAANQLMLFADCNWLKKASCILLCCVALRCRESATANGIPSDYSAVVIQAYVYI